MLNTGNRIVSPNISGLISFRRLFTISYSVTYCCMTWCGYCICSIRLSRSFCCVFFSGVWTDLIRAFWFMRDLSALSLPRFWPISLAEAGSYLGVNTTFSLLSSISLTSSIVSLARSILRVAGFLPLPITLLIWKSKSYWFADRSS